MSEKRLKDFSAGGLKFLANNMHLVIDPMIWERITVREMIDEFDAAICKICTKSDDLNGRMISVRMRPKDDYLESDQTILSIVAKHCGSKDTSNFEEVLRVFWIESTQLEYTPSGLLNSVLNVIGDAGKEAKPKGVLIFDGVLILLDAMNLEDDPYNQDVIATSEEFDDALSSLIFERTIDYQHINFEREGVDALIRLVKALLRTRYKEDIAGTNFVNEKSSAHTLAKMSGITDVQSLCFVSLQDQDACEHSRCIRRPSDINSQKISNF